MRIRYYLLSVALLAATTAIYGQQVDQVTRTLAPMSYFARQYPDLVYATANGINLRLDLTIPNGSLNAWQHRLVAPKPTVIAIHGGGWIKGKKEGFGMQALPFLVKGMAVVNIEYRLAGEALAPAAVEDCRCALRWVFRHAQEYGFDPSRVVIFGESAGGHLSLLTGMLRSSDGFDSECPAEPAETEPHARAIVEFVGITDVGDLLDGPHRQSFAVRWLGDQPNRMELAKRLSPINYVREGAPPTLIVHGDADDVVPYQQSVALHNALDGMKVPNQLITLSSAHHGQFTEEQLLTVYPAIYSFLEQHGVLSPEH